MTIRSKAPLRLGLAGGGTDVSPYCDLYGGLVLNATINLYAYCTIEETDNGMIEIHSWDSGVHETLKSQRRLDIDGKASLIKGVYNRVVSDFDLPPLSMRITTHNEAPIGSGLGTSSTMVVCILKAFAEWHNLPLGDYAAFGGFNFIEFHANDLTIVNPLKIKRWIKDELEASMLLYYTGRSRLSAEIISEQQRNTREGNQEAIEAMHLIKQSAIDTKVALLKGDIGTMADLLQEQWKNKQKMASGITSNAIRKTIDVAMEAGAQAGKISGAGGGGYIFFFVDPTRKQAVADALTALDGHTMHFNFSEGGAQSWKIYPTDKVNKM